VLGHMRSYSTVLCHVLNSNPAIDGYVELHRSYRSPRHLLDLHVEVERSLGHPPTGRYLLDKILDNRHEISPSIIRRDDVFVVFSIREPMASVRSTVAMAREHLQESDWRRDATRVAEYYASRLDRLVELASLKDDGRSIFFEADRLLDDTPTVLQRLGTFLELDTPLTEEYETLELTGRPVLGDPSPVIKTGRIVRGRDVDDTSIDVPDRAQTLVVDAFERARRQLADACADIL
jgi:hypothetical protein